MVGSDEVAKVLQSVLPTITPSSDHSLMANSIMLGWLTGSRG